jgi:hypothetical protein
MPSSFFGRLSSRTRAHTNYFQTHFLSSSPICQCNLFPVYSSKLGQLTSGCKLAAVKHLCLACICHVLDWEYGTEPEIGDVFLTDEMLDEYNSYYNTFYNRDETSALLQEEDYDFFECSMQVIMPWLSKRGVKRTCPHTGVPFSCDVLSCARGTEPVALT